MLHKTRGIVLNYIKFKESSIICKIFTEKFGLESYIINGARSSKGKNKIALYQPLTLLELVVYKNDKKNIQRISEAKTFHLYKDTQTNIFKISIATFLTEVLLKSSSSEENQEALYDFFLRSFLLLDELNQKETSHFHLYFLIAYLKEMGYISIPHQIVNTNTKIALSLDGLETQEKLFSANLDSSTRRQCLDEILLFYREHLGTGNLKSLDVLQQLF